MVKQIDIASWLAKHPTSTPLVDVRSPKEFEKGHIPNAINIPLFTNEERKEVGILYKKQGRDIAVMKGLELVGPKLAAFAAHAKDLAIDKRIAVHCWRGGMRSESMAWLWDKAGMDVQILTGGYKAYRKKVHEDFRSPFQFIVLAGKTGSGKTDILKALEEAGEQVIDLEELAHHKGSVFGGMGQEDQPTGECFENTLHHRLSRMDRTKPIWLEDESHGIGKVHIPEGVWVQMKKAPIIVVECSLENRVARLVDDYGRFPVNDLAVAIQKIGQRLGGLRLKEALASLESGQLGKVAELSLTYYDKTYSYSLGNRKEQVIGTVTHKDCAKEVAQQLILHSRKIHS
ncbi:MAG: tRNA 2-selenouridine(34) synthase MnmH [Bacteroidota bacterium]